MSPSRAGFGARLIALVIDGLVLSLASGALALALGPVRAFAVVQLGALAYFVGFEGGPTGQTPGKRVMGIKVVAADAHEPAGYGKALIRWVGRFLSALPCGLGYVWALFDQDGRTWHDMLAETEVVAATTASDDLGLNPADG